MDRRGYVRGLTRTRPPVIHRWCMGAIVGRRFVWELGDGTSHTRERQHTSSGFVHNDVTNQSHGHVSGLSLAMLLSRTLPRRRAWRIDPDDGLKLRF